MRQVIQNLKTGETVLAEVPAPQSRPGCLLIRTRASLVSAGTERMLVEFGKAGWIEKARRQPDKVRQVIEKTRTDGLAATWNSVQAKLDQPLPLGYSNVGKVIEVGAGVEGLAPGDRVVSNGPHAEVVCVPRNLCARAPDEVSDEAAAFVVVAAIGLQGIRLLGPTLGECIVVTGLGLIGQLCVQLLRAHGCRVLGIDLDPGKCALARQFGAEVVDLSRGEDPVSATAQWTDGRGVDGVLITASTKSSEPVHQAATMCRKRGRIVLVGVTGLELSRADFYEKELTFQVSCSYGPGRHDPAYEEKGQDYPLGYVRWTEQRNFEAVLAMMEDGRLDVQPLISHRFPFEEAVKAYQALSEEKPLGILLEYGDRPPPDTVAVAGVRTIALPSPAPAVVPEVVVGVIGAGNFTGQVLLPALKATGARLRVIASSTGLSGAHLGRKFGFEQTTTETAAIISDSEVNTVVITTRHNTHARWVLEALKAGKRVFVEKPLCLCEAELAEIEAAVRDAGEAFVMVGFNRRFAPQVVEMKRLLGAVREPKHLVMTVNAGFIPATHWTQDPEVGGGRILGEGCHFIDLLRFLVGERIERVQVTGGRTQAGPPCPDNVSIGLGFADGSHGVVHYLAGGHKSFPKERLEVFTAGRVLQLNNYRRLRGYGWPGFRKMNLWRQAKGHPAEMRALVQAVRDGAECPIPWQEIVEVTRATIQAGGGGAEA